MAGGVSERFFPNTLPDFTGVEDVLEEDNKKVEAVVGFPITAVPVGMNTTIPAREPSTPANELFVRAGRRILNQCIEKSWTQVQGRVYDPFIYSGVGGLAVPLLRSFEISREREDLDMCLEILQACAGAAARKSLHVSFLCGQAGIYAVGAAAAHAAKKQDLEDAYLERFQEIASLPALCVRPEEGGFGIPYEILYGRAGFLYAALYINAKLEREAIPHSITGPVVSAIIAAGRAAAGNGKCPLMYQWHGTRYWGAAHGLAGIMQMLLQFPLKAEDLEAVKCTLLYMVKHRFPGGNYPSNEGSPRDRLVHWCHGAPGVAMTLCTAAKVFKNAEGMKFLEAAIEAGDIVWHRGVLRRLGLCHGISGNAYTFLTLYHSTMGKKHLHRARELASFLYHHWEELVASEEMHGGDAPYSLFEGRAGLATLFLDMAAPEKARFPGFQL